MSSKKYKQINNNKKYLYQIILFFQIINNDIAGFFTIFI